jgi:hypothetical protein
MESRHRFEGQRRNLSSLEDCNRRDRTVDLRLGEKNLNTFLRESKGTRRTNKSIYFLCFESYVPSFQKGIQSPGIGFLIRSRGYSFHWLADHCSERMCLSLERIQ